MLCVEWRREGVERQDREEQPIESHTSIPALRAVNGCITLLVVSGEREFDGAWMGALKRLKDFLGPPSLGRRLGEDASPEGLTPSFRTRVVAEPAL